MKHKKFGFTLIEVSLFLAVTGLLFVGIMVGTQNSIWQQRYNDAVQSYANFLRNIYAEVSNPQSLGDGRSEWALYGKLVTFGQIVGLDGNNLDGKQRFFVYDLVGKADSSEGVDMTGPIMDVLSDLEAGIVKNQDSHFMLMGTASGYSPNWGSVIENTEGDRYTGSILVVRHPGSGTIMTLVYDGVFDINSRLKNNEDFSLSDYLNADSFRMKQVDFCLDPYGIAGENGPMNRDIRILKNAHNASGVEIIDLDSGDSECPE